MSADVVVITVSVLLIGFLWWFFFGPKQARSASVVGAEELCTALRSALACIAGSKAAPYCPATGIGGDYRCVDASHMP